MFFRLAKFNVALYLSENSVLLSIPGSMWTLIGDLCTWVDFTWLDLLLGSDNVKYVTIHVLEVGICIRVSLKIVACRNDRGLLKDFSYPCKGSGLFLFGSLSTAYFR